MKWLALIFLSLPVFAQVGPYNNGGAQNVDTWNVQQVYAIGQVVLRRGVVYQSLVTNNVAFDPAGSQSQWSNVVGSASCTTCAVTTSPLSQFASTTSAQLASVLSDATGTGPNVFATGSLINPTSIGATTPGTGVFTNATAKHAFASGTAPTVAAGAAAGTGPTVSVTGNDGAGVITLTTGTSPGTQAALLTLTFNSVYGVAPNFILSPYGSGGGYNATVLSGGSQVWVVPASGSVVINAGNVALTASTQYVWQYITVAP